ncbi:beta strand repeat-containing protein [Luethyella okanaganae]|uniref:Beta strand repeat-containing protein n=1 Tax=Luethyella okanaganae TaxID=69372 RepID=A0ABW1VF31_9MICO
MNVASPSTSPHVRVRDRILAVLTAFGLATAGALVAAEPAAAAATSPITVQTTADADGNGACAAGSIVDTASPVTLRNALCVASNLGTAVEVIVPAGTYLLDGARGPLALGTQTGSAVTVTGASAAATVITGDGTHQLMNIDQNLVGSVTVELSGLTFDGGVDNTFGGGAIIAGSGGSAATGDTLVVNDSVFTQNSANTTAGPTANPGGAIQFIGGALEVNDSTFQNNSSGTSSGGAIAYQAMGLPGEHLIITGSTFTGNAATSTTPAAIGGGALDLAVLSGTAPLSITGTSFVGNTVTGAAANPARGGAIQLNSGTLSITGSSITGNQIAGGPPAAGAGIHVAGGALNAHYNRFDDNVGGVAVFQGPGSVDATNNWWGCPAGPGNSGCDTVDVTNASAYTPYLTLNARATPAMILPGGTSTAVTADLLLNSGGSAIVASDLGAFAGLPVVWSDLTPGASSVASSSSPIVAGVASTTYLPNGALGLGSVKASLDDGGVVVPIAIAGASLFTSAASANALVGAPFTFTLTTSGYPVPSLAQTTGALPAGLTFSDNGDGTATISGTPTVTGAVSLAFTATNGYLPDAVQNFALQVVQAPSITSATTTTFTAGVAGSFTVTTAGFPMPSQISTADALPAGVTFTDNGDGTATIAGIPDAGTGGPYPLAIEAVNGVTPDASQSFTVIVDESATITSADNTTFSVGAAGTFTVTTDAGFPVATTLNVTGALPAGVTFVDNGSGTATLSGTPLSGEGGSYPLTFTASNGTVPAVQPFTLTVTEAPVVTLQPSPQTVNAGNPASFSAGASGFPFPTVQWQVSTTGGVSWADIVGATSTTLGFTAVQAQDGNLYRALFSNGVDVLSVSALLVVGTQPTITSAAAAAFVVGGGVQFFTVTATGVPDASFTTVETLPAWLALDDNGDGTASLHGMPPAASGGQHPFTIEASNGFLPIASQPFVLTVNEAPTIVAATGLTQDVGDSITVPVTTTGYPLSITLTSTGAPPAGVTFADNGDGTATLAGTPAVGTGGVYPLTFTASNGVQPDAVHAFTLTLNEGPTITSADTTTFVRGATMSFTVTSSAGYPSAASFSETGALPAGVSFTDNGDGSATLLGMTTAMVGSVALSITASNGVVGLDAVQAFTFVVADAAVVPLPLTVPVGDGALGGVPSTVAPGQVLNLTGTGFAVGAPVTFGIYSSPVALASAVADATGAVTVTVTIPGDYAGPHSLVASGVSASGGPRLLRADTVVVAPATPGSGTTFGSGAKSGLSSTGVAGNVTLLAMLALFALAIGIVALLVLRRRRV